jgi:hypothetical protein
MPNIMPKSIAPEDATSPKRNWSIIKILDKGEEESMAVALGKWNGVPVIGLRWNGTAENPIGNPQSRGLATWFVLEQGRYTEAIISSLPLATQKLVREFIPAASA